MWSVFCGGAPSIRRRPFGEEKAMSIDKRVTSSLLRGPVLGPRLRLLVSNPLISPTDLLPRRWA